MGKRNIYLVGLGLAVLLFAGCRNADVKETGADVANVEEIQETSVPASEEEIIVEGNKGVIRIGTTGTPYSELLTQAKIQLAKNGWDVQIEIYSDHEKINQDVLNGNLDAHLFAHQTYIDSYNDVNETQLTTAAEICFEKYGIYSVLNEDLTKTLTNMTVGIPEDGTRQAKALLFLQDTGYITLAEGAGLTAILDDITDNPKNIEFITYNMDTARSVLDTADYCVMGADQAILAGLEPHKDVLKEESTSFVSAHSMAALLVTTQEKVDSEALRVLETALKSEDTQKFVEDTYKEAIGLFP